VGDDVFAFFVLVLVLVLAISYPVRPVAIS
jgi:hypothetical protein